MKQNVYLYLAVVKATVINKRSQIEMVVFLNKFGVSAKKLTYQIDMTFSCDGRSLYFPQRVL